MYMLDQAGEKEYVYTIFFVLTGVSNCKMVFFSKFDYSSTGGTYSYKNFGVKCEIYFHFELVF